MAIAENTAAHVPNIADRLQVRVFVSARFEIATGWNTPNVYSSFWRLYINDRDGAFVRLEHDDYALTAGSAHLIPAWVRFDCHNRRPLLHAYIHFEVVGLPLALMKACFGAPAALPLRGPVGATAKAWLADFQRLPAHDLQAACRTKALIFTALGELVGSLTPEQRTRFNRQLLGNQSITPALDYIEANLGADLDNARLAGICHVSEDHFIRLFRQSVGQTPAQYTLERRIGAAAQQLVFSTQKIEALATQLGFSDRFHFSRAFTKRMGLPPAAYRNSMRV